MKFLGVDKKRLVLVVVSVIMMGFCLSFLNKCNFGTDPCTVFNLGAASKLGLSLGNWQALFNCILLVVVILFDRGQIGWGTLANMFLVGYSFDFFTWVNSFWIPESFYEPMLVRILIAVPFLALFVFAVATYISSDLGTSPYDAIPMIVSSKLPKIPFKFVRMCYDILFAVLGFLFGSTIGVVTVVMAFALGPVITWVKVNLVDKYLVKEK